ncbi:uncharacterized protein LOC116416223 [Nasonia vitripennis]|uniref:Integrase core domain-containing protein n=1 Tax=Nasonia vitripennis TaxID=7425 RepID=A0A7M7Q4W2_NASVI|nr:uncharacterized protein LOC116416223 [Nasonia vitripennis]
MEVVIRFEEFPDVHCPIEDGYISMAYLHMYPQPFILVYGENKQLAIQETKGFKVVEGVLEYKVVSLKNESMEVNSFIELILQYFFKRYTYEEICLLLKQENNISITVRNLRKILKHLKLKRKNIVESPKEVIVATVIHEVFNDGLNLGYRAMHQRLRKKYRLLVKQSTVLEILRLVDPVGVENRSRYRLKRRTYKVPGPNYAWHIDGHDKLKRYGFAIHGCVDGYSKKVMWLHVSTSNNDPTIVAYYYLQCLKEFDVLPTLIRAHTGTENTVVELLQMALRFHHTNEKAGEKSFIKGKSTSNERIEKYWRQLRNHFAEYYMSIFKTMEDNGVLDIDDKIQQSLEYVKKEWNEHRIRKQNNIPSGIPNVMYFWPQKYGDQNCSQKVDQRNVDNLLNKYTKTPIFFNKHVQNLIKMLVPKYEVPRHAEEAYNLFVQILRLMNS